MSIFSPFDLHLFHEGTHQRLFEKLGAHPHASGTYFGTWSPGARYVSVIGDFNHWDRQANPLAQLADPSIWEGGIESAGEGSLYKYYIESGESAYDEPDRFAFCVEPAPGDASVICSVAHEWNEGDWPHHRHGANSLESPITICAGDADSAKEMGFTHLLLPGAKGFAPAETVPAELKFWIERLHQRGLGTALDLALPVDEWLGPEQRSIDLSCSVFWLEKYHADLLIGRDLIRDDGWREDLYRYLSIDPIRRRDHHEEITRRIQWAFERNFVLPVMAAPAGVPGNDWDRAATVRLVLAWMYALPGKKLLRTFDDHHLDLLVGQLNYLYRTTPALYKSDHFSEGFRWLEAENAELNIASFIRRERGGPDAIVFIANFSPVPRPNYRIGVPGRGTWHEMLNTDAAVYGGRGHGNLGGVDAVPIPLHGQRYSITVTVPPLAGLFFRNTT